MQVESQPVADAVEHPDPAAVALLGRVTGGLEARDQFLLQRGSVGAVAHLFHHPPFALLHGGVLPAQRFGGAPAHDRPRQVAVIMVARVAGKNIEHDGLVGAERTVAALVRIAALFAARDDGIGGRSPGVKHGGVHLGAQPLGGEGNFPPH
jgi:hypothetical protein